MRLSLPLPRLSLPLIFKKKIITQRVRNATSEQWSTLCIRFSTEACGTLLHLRGCGQSKQTAWDTNEELLEWGDYRGGGCNIQEAGCVYLSNWTSRFVLFMSISLMLWLSEDNKATLKTGRLQEATFILASDWQVMWSTSSNLANTNCTILLNQQHFLIGSVSNILSDFNHC